MFAKQSQFPRCKDGAKSKQGHCTENKALVFSPRSGADTAEARSMVKSVKPKPSCLSQTICSRFGVEGCQDFVIRLRFVIPCTNAALKALNKNHSISRHAAHVGGHYFAPQLLPTDGEPGGRNTRIQTLSGVGMWGFTTLRGEGGHPASPR